MSRILSVDTSTDACSAALWLDGEITSEFVIEPRRHTHLILPMVERLLAAAEITTSQLDAIAFGRGPGSFAGIRIATGVAQGLALGADLSLIPVSTLASMAVAVSDKAIERNMPVLALLDARMNEVYWGLFDFSDNLPRLQGEEHVNAPADVDVSIPDDCIAVGSGLSYRDELPVSLSKRLIDCVSDVYPSASDMLVLAENELQQGRTVPPEQALPVYLRQGTWKKRSEQ